MLPSLLPGRRVLRSQMLPSVAVARQLLGEVGGLLHVLLVDRVDYAASVRLLEVEADSGGVRLLLGGLESDVFLLVFTLEYLLLLIFQCLMV